MAEQTESLNPAAHGQSRQYSEATVSKPETKPQTKAYRIQFLQAPREEGTVKQTLNRDVKTNKNTVIQNLAVEVTMWERTEGGQRLWGPHPNQQCHLHECVLMLWVCFVHVHTEARVAASPRAPEPQRYEPDLPQTLVTARVL